jgi:hypothetical protein
MNRCIASMSLDAQWNGIAFTAFTAAHRVGYISGTPYLNIGFVLAISTVV